MPPRLAAHDSRWRGAPSNSRSHRSLHKIIGSYDAATRPQQTARGRFPRIPAMEQATLSLKETSIMLEQDIRQFIAAARQHLLGAASLSVRSH